jgi:hypothetical protein
MTQLHSLPVLELRSQAQGLVTGYASVFNGVDSYGDCILPGAFSATLAKHRAAGTSPAMLWAHQQSEPIGRWLALAEDSRGLRVEGQLNLKTSAGQDAFEHLRAGDVNGLSIGYRVPRNGSEQRDDGVTLLKALDLYEVSVVALPADGAARISAVKAQPVRPATIRELEEALGSLGFSRREARHIAAKGFSGLADANGSEDVIQALRAATQRFRSLNI